MKIRLLTGAETVKEGLCRTHIQKLQASDSLDTVVKANFTDAPVGTTYATAVT